MGLRWRIAQAAEIRWWERYLKQKPKSEYLNWKKNYWTDFLKKINITPLPKERILDAGCGPAGIFMIFENKDVHALDPLLEEYQEKLKHFEKKDYPNVDFISLPLEEFSITKPYDKVFCLNAINHVADLDLCFDNIIAATKKGGQLIVSIDAHNYAFFKQLFRLLPGDILHPHQYDLNEYKTMLTTRGCQIERTTLMKKEFFFNYFTIVATKL